MDYAIQICVNQASVAPKVVRTSIEKGRPLDEVIMIAEARLEMAPTDDGKIITDESTIDLAVVGPDARQHLGGFLLRHGRIYSGVRTWTQAYRRWLTTVRFDHPAQQIVLQDYIDAVTDAERRVDRLTRQITEHLPGWSMAPVATAIQAMRGVALINAVTIVAEVGDFSRFGNPRQLMAYLGLVPSEHSSGGAVRRGGITKAGNLHARRALIEGAWTYRMQARVSRKLYDRLEALPQNVRDIAWKAQVRLCSRWRRLAASGKPKVVVTTAIAREMAGFIWAIARQVQPRAVG
jgi:transposase